VRSLIVVLLCLTSGVALADDYTISVPSGWENDGPDHEPTLQSWKHTDRARGGVVVTRMGNGAAYSKDARARKEHLDLVKRRFTGVLEEAGFKLVVSKVLTNPMPGIEVDLAKSDGTTIHARIWLLRDRNLVLAIRVEPSGKALRSDAASMIASFEPKT
jgi:hypothetical protein